MIENGITVIVSFEGKKMKIISNNEKRNTFNLVIYCPECNEPFSTIEPNQCYCTTYYKYFSEDEVRKRCGL